MIYFGVFLFCFDYILEKINYRWKCGLLPFILVFSARTKFLRKTEPQAILISYFS